MLSSPARAQSATPNKRYATLKQIDAGVLNVGYAEDGPADGPPLILLHDSLGCVELWRDFPGLLAQRLQRPVLAYDRLGFGKSAPRAAIPGPEFIDEEARRDFPAAIAHFRRAHAIDPDHRAALVNLTRLLIDIGHDEPGELAACLERMLVLDPDDPMARHLLDGVRGHVSAVAPRRYISEMFDAVAGEYDAMMLDRLG